MKTITTVKHIMKKYDIKQDMIIFHQEQINCLKSKAYDKKITIQQQNIIFAQISVHKKMLEFWANVEIVEDESQEQ